MSSRGRRRSLRYSVVFNPHASTDSLRLSYEPTTRSGDAVEIEEEDDSSSTFSSSKVKTAAVFALMQVINYGVLVPVVLFWKGLLRLLHFLGIPVNGATLVMFLFQIFFFWPLAIVARVGEAMMNLLGLTLDGPTTRGLFSLGLNGFGFAWHAAHDTLATPSHHWKKALDRFQTFMEQNGLDLEMKMALNERFLNNISVYDDVQRMLGLGICNRVEETKMDPKAVDNNTIPSLDEAAHFMHFATAVYGTAVVVGTLIETNNMDRMRHIQKQAGSANGVDDMRQVLAFVDCKEEDVVVSHLTAGGSMDVLRHLVVVDHKAKALVFAIRGTFSISGVIADWVSFCGRYCTSDYSSETTLNFPLSIPDTVC